MASTGNKGDLHAAAFIDSMDPGGAEEVALNLAAGLPAYGIRVTVLHFGNPWIAAQARARGLDQAVLDDRHYRSIITLPLFLRAFARRLRDLEVDVLHGHLLGAVFAGALAARYAGIPSVGTLHDVYSLHDSPWNPRYLRWAERAGCRLVAVCDAMRDEVQRVCRIAGVTRIYNGVDLTRFPSVGARLRANTVRIACVARAVPVKRLDLLIRAFVAIKTDTPAELHILGDGPLLPGLRRRAETLGIGGRVVFHGHRDDVPAFLADCDIYVLVSDSEGMSVSILESMAAGLPAVVTDVGGNRELVADGVSGRVVARGDEPGIASALSELVLDAGHRSQFGAQARQRVTELFTVERMCGQYARLMQELPDRE